MGTFECNWEIKEREEVYVTEGCGLSAIKLSSLFKISQIGF